MPAIDALGIWKQLAAECGEALNYYTRQFSSPSERKQEVLIQGAADFDSKYTPNDENEKDHYRTDYYVSAEGYMNMHLEQNLAVLQDCFSKGIPQPIVFVDFGCGPMTSGLALAEILSKQASGNRMQTAYFGVDASENMMNKANCISEEYKLFPKYFKVVHDTEFNAQKIPDSFPETKIVLLSLSFVLAPETLGKSDVPSHAIAKKLADDWKRFIANKTQCRETIIIYINPVDYREGLHYNWLRIFRDEMKTANNAGSFKYIEHKMKEVPVQSVPNVALAVIEGTRQ